PAFMSHEDPQFADLILPSQSEDEVLTLPAQLAEWLTNLLSQLVPEEDEISYQELDEYYQQYFDDNIEELINSEVWSALRSAGLIVLR
ncbi:MAG: hypothetical protein NE334_11855, partial [Lentisphaeraceae bacterium]|nr:hypothetical protein [Lentisphaeraceae bacterium]